MEFCGSQADIYPWGSGETQSERNRTFLSTVEDMRVNQKMSEAEIARGFGMSTTDLRAVKSIAKNEERQADIAMAQRLKNKGTSNVAIGKRMGINESQVRALLAPGQKAKADVLEATSQMLKDEVAEKSYIDIGTGVERHLGISQTKLSTAVARLKEEGYKVDYVKVEQLGTGKKTTIKVLTAPGTEYSELFANRHHIKQLNQVQRYSVDGGLTYPQIGPPVSISSKRVAVRYAKDGGAEADGVIYIRPGVDDVSLGASHYAQVRIAVDGSHYLKGMAMYRDDLPPGVDLEFNTNKNDTGTKLDAMKKVSSDPDNPFGAMISRQHGVMNVVNEEGDWEDWSKNLSSQFLSKQSLTLANDQLREAFERRRLEFNEIMSLTNPDIRRKLLDAFADGADSAAVHLKAAALPRTANHVILPISTMKETEVYAPNYRDGERVVLIRHPHGGIFEIPELTVNNRHPEAKKLLGKARDAVGISSLVAERLSGADFDGDTVLVVPNNQRKIKTAPALEGLKGFDPKASYPPYEGMPQMSSRTKGVQMGMISNLIADMHVRGATWPEIAAAVRHSMVVIDAEKHNLNYRQSAIDNGISNLKLKYQGAKNAGAKTLISRSGTSSTVRVAERNPRSMANGGPIDKATGKRVFEETGVTYVDQNGKLVKKTTEVTRLGNVDDAHELSSGTPIEKIYGDHSNRLKKLANDARKEMVSTESIPYSPEARVKYADQVKRLDAALNLALRNSPLERQAQVVANALFETKRQSYPNMDKAEIKKLRAQALNTARQRTGAKKQRIKISDDEWAAIQAGAIRTNKLTQILANTDLEKVKELATPKTKLLLDTAKTAKAKKLLASGYTMAQVADALGVSVSTLKRSVSETAS